jgi:hypothetical protein
MSFIHTHVFKLFPLIKYLVRNKLFLIIIFLIVPVSGLICSTYYEPSAFQRSGALLVCLAIISVYINHLLQRETNFAKAMVKEAEGKGESIEAIANNINPEITDNEIRKQCAEALFTYRELSMEELPKLLQASRNTVGLEFAAGVFGTLIWGFGDVLFT